LNFNSGAKALSEYNRLANDIMKRLLLLAAPTHYESKKKEI